MTSREFSDLLRYVRSKFLAKMARDGFWYREKLRHDPIPWDINNGLCEEFADAIHGLAPEAEGYDAAEFDPETDSAHVFIKWGETFYDAENVRGVGDWRRLPLFQGRTREQALEEMRLRTPYRGGLR